MEVHHITLHSEGGSDTLDNAIPLCFDCHGDMRSYDHTHPKGTKYSRTELIRRRDAWYAIVNERGVLPPSSASETDKAVFHHFLATLPWSGSIKFIKENNFAGFPFDLDRLCDLDTFVGNCDNPTFSFEDSDLESARMQLLSAIHLFNRAIGRYTFRLNGTTSHSSVPSEWEFEQPDQFDLAVNTIHSAAIAAYSAYSNLIRSGKAKLGIVALA